MKAESNTMPQHPFTVDKRGGMADITFFDNVRRSEDEEGLIWLYDTYCLTVPFREDLPALVAEQYDLWLDTAMSLEGPYYKEPTEAERLAVLEMAMLEIIMGGLS